MFTSWLLLQRDRDDSVGLLAKTLWGDYNAGCASAFRSPLEWVAHFEKKHRKVSEFVTRTMGDAYVEFLDELKQNKELF